MSDFIVPFSRPASVPGELEHVRQALSSGLLSGDGPFARRCEELLAAQLEGSRVLLTPSCTAALELSAILLDLEPGDEVIVPSFTFPSTATAFALRRARIVFADIRPDTMNIDERRLASLVTERTRAIVVVHYGGVACAMDAIGTLAAEHGIPVIEDNAHGLGARYLGRQLGAMGAFGALSFHATKNVSCGEGGALVLADEHHVTRAEIIREKGTNRSQFWRGEVDKYTWVDEGSSFLLPELAAAVLLAQLESFDSIQARRKALWERYDEGLRGWAARVGAQLPVVPAGCDQAYHLYYVLMPSDEERDRLQQWLLQRGILAVSHYVPLHSSPHGRRVGNGECPTAEDVSHRLLRLPFYTELAVEDVDLVVKTVKAM